MVKSGPRLVYFLATGRSLRQAVVIHRYYAVVTYIPYVSLAGTRTLRQTLPRGIAGIAGIEMNRRDSLARPTLDAKTFFMQTVSAESSDWPDKQAASIPRESEGFSCTTRANERTTGEQRA